jgi:hypothetical protein
MLILIAGITGSFGQSLAKTALSRGLSVRGLGRTPSNLNPDISSQLESFVQSSNYYDIPALEKAVSGVDVVINAYSPTPVLDLDGHLLLLRAAERADVKVFVASSWSRDWTNIQFGDFEHYNNHKAFQHQVANTSPIKPVYIINGIFADLLWSPYGPGAFEAGEKPKMKYWGDHGKTDKHPWIAQGDAAEWTIDILLHGEGVQAGNGGIFKIQSGNTTIEELAAVYENVYGTKVEVVCEGSAEELESKLAEMRKVPAPLAYFGWMSEAAALVASKGLWEMKKVDKLVQFRTPVPLEQWLREKRSSA